jgi:hypothetical protein
MQRLSVGKIEVFEVRADGTVYLTTPSVSQPLAAFTLGIIGIIPINRNVTICKRIPLILKKI